jgi:hypothetical protein
MTVEYTEEVLNVVCPSCHAAKTGRCLVPVIHGSNYRREPHRERVWKAKGYRWYCFDCDEMVAEAHIRTVHDSEGQTGTCRVSAAGVAEVAA